MTYFYIMGALATFFSAISYWLFKHGAVYNPPEDDMASTDHSETTIYLKPTDTAPPPPKTSPQAVSSPTATFRPMIVKWAKAIAQWEGAKPQSNNPGNLKISALTTSWGASKGRKAADGGNFCQFKTQEDGMNALCNFLTLGAEGQLIIAHPKPCTLEQFTVRFAGNPPEGYKKGIYKLLGVTGDTDISTFLA